MPFDAKVLLRDGTGDLDATEEVKSLTPSAEGAVAVDLRESPVKGLAAVVVVPEAPTGTTPTLDVIIEECATVDGTYQELVTFPQITALGAYIRRFATDKQFITAKSTLGGTTPNFGKVQILISPYPFKNL